MSTVENEPASGWEEIEARLALPDPETCAKLRTRAGLTISQVARAIDVDRATLARWESGASRPTGDRLRRYAELVERLQRYRGRRR